MENRRYYGDRFGRYGEDRSQGTGYTYRPDESQISYGSRRSVYRGPDQRGRGPKGWNRSDERILEDVCETLTQDSGVDASEIDVTVQDGIVTLKGSVPTRRMKTLSEEALDDISGIQDIRNELVINPHIAR